MMSTHKPETPVRLLADLPDVCTESEAAAYLAVSVRTLANMAMANEIAYLKVGRSRRYPKGVLAQWITSATVDESSATLSKEQAIAVSHGRPRRSRRIV
jgi:excisionase family DNA binding protein